MSQIKTALLSFGMSGRVFHAPFIHLHPGFELMGSWERNEQRIQATYGYTRTYHKLEELLEDPVVELVVVNTPTFTHYEYAKKALQSGKHVVVEKAFVGTTSEAEELRDLALTKGLKLSVFQNRRWDSDFKTVNSVLERGLLGDIIEARIAFDRYKPQLSPKVHKEKPSSGAGIIKDLGAHVIDQALTLFGMPNEVFADIGVTRAHSEVDDYFDILLRYDKLRVHVHGGYFFKEQLPGFVLNGSLGTMMKSRADVQEDQLQAGMTPDAEVYGIEPEEERGLLHGELDGQPLRVRVDTLPGNYMDYYEGIYRSITQDIAEPVTADEGVNVMRIIDAAFESAKSGKVILI